MGKASIPGLEGQVQGQFAQRSESLSQSQKRLADIAQGVVQHTPRMHEPLSGPCNTQAHTGPRCVFFCTTACPFLLGDRLSHLFQAYFLFLKQDFTM